MIITLCFQKRPNATNSDNNKYTDTIIIIITMMVMIIIMLIITAHGKGEAGGAQEILN